MIWFGHRFKAKFLGSFTVQVRLVQATLIQATKLLFSPKKLGPNFFDPNLFWRTRTFLPSFLKLKANFHLTFFIDLKSFGPKIFVDGELFWINNILHSKICYDFFFIKNYLWINSFDPNFFLDLEHFWIDFSSLEAFWTQILFWN